MFLVLGVCIAVLVSGVAHGSLFVLNNVSLSLYNNLDMSCAYQAIHLLNKYHNSSDVSFISIHQLTKPSRRNMILKIDYQVLSKSKDVQSAILKQSMKMEDHASMEQGERFARDWAGLVFFNEIPSMVHRVPVFFGASRTYRFVLMEMLGSPPVSLETYYDVEFSKQNEQAAIDATNSFMAILGTMHASSSLLQDRWHEILQRIKRSSQEAPWQQRHMWISSRIRKNVNYTLSKLRITPSVEMKAEMADVVYRVFAPGFFSAVVHSDLCPDNVIFRHSISHLFDFEWAENRSVFIDAVSLRMGMPGCYYSGVAPTAVVDAAEMIYRRELEKIMPAAKDDKLYYSAYIDGCAYWTLRAFDIIRPILRGDRDSSDLQYGMEKSMRIVVMRLELFLEISERYKLLPHISNMVAATLLKLKELWAEKAVSLPMYGAFASSLT